MKYIYSTSQMSKLSLILYIFSITCSVAGLFLTITVRLTVFEDNLDINNFFFLFLLFSDFIGILFSFFLFFFLF